MRWVLLLTLPVLILSACSQDKSETQEPAKPKREDFIKVASFQGASSLAPLPEEGLLIIGKDKIDLWQDGKSREWLDLSTRSSQVWSVAFSPSWQWNQIFFVYYQNRAGGSVIAEGVGSDSEGQWRRTILKLPPSEGGSLATYNDLLFATSPRQILRINPYLSNGSAYSIPKDNPRREEYWTLLPEGNWEIDFLGEDMLIWGKDEALLWQESIEKLRGASLQNALWQGKCPLVGGFQDKESFIFLNSCSGEVLRWQEERFAIGKETIPNAVDIVKNSEGTWALLESGELLFKE